MAYDLSIPGWMSEDELQTIERIAGGLEPNSRMVEIGAFCGRTSVAWASTVPDCDVFCIDQWPDYGYFERLRDGKIKRKSIQPEGDSSLYTGSYEETFKKFTADYPNVHPLRGNSCSDMWNLFDLDLVFLDGDHTYEGVLGDLHFWWPRLRPSGLICGHDFYRPMVFPGVTRAVVEFAREHGMHIFVPNGDTVWMLVDNAADLPRWWV